MKQVILVKNIQNNQKLDDFLNTYSFSKKQKHLLKMEKRIKINQKIIQHNIDLHINDHLEIDCTYNEEIHLIPFDQPIDILYEDDVVLIVNKPIHTLVHSDGHDTHTLTHQVAQYFIDTHQKCAIHPIHRLDRDTSGCIFFCKNPFFQPYFDQCMRDKKIKRTYLAIVDGVINENITIDAPIGKDRHSNKYRVSKTGNRAITHIKPIMTKNNQSLIECTLETGRTHQIRVHCSYIHHSLIGDELYGKKSNMRCALHSHTLSFFHPLIEKNMTISCPLPKDMELCMKE